MLTTRDLLSIAIIARKQANDRTAEFLPHVVTEPEVGVMFTTSVAVHLICHARKTHDHRQRRFPALPWVSPGVKPSYMMLRMEEKR